MTTVSFGNTARFAGAEKAATPAFGNNTAQTARFSGGGDQVSFSGNGKSPRFGFCGAGCAIGCVGILAVVGGVLAAVTWPVRKLVGFIKGLLVKKK